MCVKRRRRRASSPKKSHDQDDHFFIVCVFIYFAYCCVSCLYTELTVSQLSSSVNRVLFIHRVCHTPKIHLNRLSGSDNFILLQKVKKLAKVLKLPIHYWLVIIWANTIFVLLRPFDTSKGVTFKPTFLLVVI